MNAGTTLITKTDLNGRITYANDRFARISESAVHDLPGKAHSLIRHPAMPRSAFDDLWQTIQAGNPWRGVVVNRALSGNHYRIDANVAPCRENGKFVGYISVRRKADDIARRISSISQTTQYRLKDAMSLEEVATSTDEAAKVLRQTVASFRV